MTLFWNRQNEPIEDTIEWAIMFEDAEFRIVACDQDDEGTPMVSTIWNGLDRGLSLHPTPETVLIFETAYLVNGNVEQVWFDNTEEAALDRHRMVCLSMLGREPLPDGGLKNIIVANERQAKRK